jgi:hypothetical protein
VLGHCADAFAANMKAATTAIHVQEIADSFLKTFIQYLLDHPKGTEIDLRKWRPPSCCSNRTIDKFKSRADVARNTSRQMSRACSGTAQMADLRAGRGVPWRTNNKCALASMQSNTRKIAIDRFR